MSGSDEAVIDGTVELLKIFPGGAEESVDIGAVTIDETGSYEIPHVDVAETGNGEADDFYYEVRVNGGAGTDARAPAAPSDDTTVDVSPGTNLAARILSEVAEVPGETDLATPSEDLIEAIRERSIRSTSFYRPWTATRPLAQRRPAKPRATWFVGSTFRHFSSMRTIAFSVKPLVALPASAWMATRTATAGPESACPFRSACGRSRPKARSSLCLSPGKGSTFPDNGRGGIVRRRAMGLLDDLLGSLAGQPTDGPATQQPPQPEKRTQPTQTSSGGGVDMSRVMMAMLPIVLAMLSNRGRQANAPSQAGYGPSAGGGGLADILGQVLGGAGGRGGAGGGLGGLGGLLQQLRRAGFASEADSWVSGGQNRSLPPDAMGKVFGREGIEEIARRTGFAEADISRGLSQLLPEVVDRVTPNGEVPDLDSLSASVDDLARRLGRG